MSNCNVNDVVASIVNKIICLTTPCIFASHFLQIEVDLSSICGFILRLTFTSFQTLFCSIFGFWDVFFLAKFRRNTCKTNISRHLFDLVLLL